MDSNKLSQFDYLKGKVFKFEEFSSMTFTYVCDKVSITVGGSIYALRGEDLYPIMTYEELIKIEVVEINDSTTNLNYYW